MLYCTLLVATYYRLLTNLKKSHKLLNYKLEMDPGRIELPTQGFSVVS